MSLEATENVQPAAVPAAGTRTPATAASQAPAEPAEPAAAAGPAAAAEAAAGAAGAAGAEPADAAKLPHGAEPPGTAQLPEAARPAGPAGPAEAGEPGEPIEPPAAVELPDATDLPPAVERTELVGLAEPAEAGEPTRRRRGLAFALLFVIVAAAIIGGAIGTVGALTHGFRKDVTVKYHESAVFKLRTGDCINTPNSQKVSVLPCSTPHQAEVFGTFTLPAGAWPGTAAIRTEASSGCAALLTGYLNPQLAISLRQSYVFPDKVAWTGGTRTVICEVQATSGQLTGSVAGAA
jgi:Septum formation